MAISSWNNNHWSGSALKYLFTTSLWVIFNYGIFIQSNYSCFHPLHSMVYGLIKNVDHTVSKKALLVGAEFFRRTFIRTLIDDPSSVLSGDYFSYFYLSPALVHSKRSLRQCQSREGISTFSSGTMTGGKFREWYVQYFFGYIPNLLNALKFWPTSISLSYIANGEMFCSIMVIKPISRMYIFPLYNRRGCVTLYLRYTLIRNTVSHSKILRMNHIQFHELSVQFSWHLHRIRIKDLTETAFISRTVGCVWHRIERKRFVFLWLF